MKKESRLLNRWQHYLWMVVVITIAPTLGATWYVDPVNGDDAWDGSWLEPVPYRDHGPLATIDTATSLATNRDVIVLLDGVYTGPENVGSDILFTIVDKKLTVFSLYGPNNCIFELYENLHLFTDRVNGYTILQSVFDGVTFVGWTNKPYNDNSAVLFSNIYIEFNNCIFQDFNSSRLMRPQSMVHLEFDNCTFINNNCSEGIITFDGSPCILQLDQCFFLNNQSRQQIMIGSGVDTNIFNCTFSDNIGTDYFNAIHIVENSTVNIDGCTINNNHCPLDSSRSNAGINCEYASLTVSNTQIENITSAYGHNEIYGIKTMKPRKLIVENCMIQNTQTGIGFSQGTSRSGPFIIKNTQFLENTQSNTYADDYRFGGIVIEGELMYPVQIQDCTFMDNWHGITTSVWINEPVTISNCLFAHNESIALAVFGKDWAPVQVTNCTIVDNPQGIDARFSQFKNCIIRNTYFNTEDYGGHPLLDYVTVDYSFVQGGWAGPGTGNITDPPIFVDYYGRDYHLQSLAGHYDPATDSWIQDTVNSPCIDTGDPADEVGDEPYGSGGRINMGFYGGTSQASKSDICSGGIDGTGKMLSDFNHDCTTNLADFARFASEWLQTTKAH